MAEDEGSRRRRQSGVLDAIFDAVGEKEEAAPAAQSSPFRASALASIDVPVQVDNLLPLTSRRTWLALIGVAAVIAAFLIYAGGTTSTREITVSGRAVAASGIAQAASPGAIAITDVLAPEGATVSAGQAIARGVTPDGGAIDVRSPVAGTIWQSLVVEGGVADLGTVVATVLPVGSDASILVAVDESQAAKAGSAIRVDVVSSDGTSTTADIASVAASPLPAATAQGRTAVLPEDESPQTMIALVPATALTPGSEVSVSFVLSEQSLLASMLGFE